MYRETEKETTKQNTDRTKDRQSNIAQTTYRKRQKETHTDRQSIIGQPLTRTAVDGVDELKVPVAQCLSLTYDTLVLLDYSGDGGASVNTEGLSM